MDSIRTIYSASARNLRRLLAVRGLVILGQFLLLWYLLDRDISARSRDGMLLTLLALTTISLLSLLRSFAPRPVTIPEFGTHLGIDVVGLSVFLYFGGGASNPFVAYYLVSLAISAALLPRRYTWSIAALSLLACSLLLFFHVPLAPFSPPQPGQQGLGLWLVFLVALGLITLFVTGMASALRRQERQAIEAREDELRHEQILAIAGLAAGTAEELSAPLGSMSVLLDELQAVESNARRQEDYQMLADQLRQCERILEKLSRTAQMTRAGDSHRVDVVEYTRSIVNQWLVLRPEVGARVSVSGDNPAPLLEVEFTLGQALENLLNNAANAWSKDILIDVDWTMQEISIAVTDKGPGVPASLMDKMGKPIIREDGSGLGLGLLLSHAAVKRYGGDIKLENMPGGGTRATMNLPR